MKKIQPFKPKKPVAIFPIEKTATYFIMALLQMITSLSAFFQSTLFKTKNDALKCKKNASKQTSVIHVNNLTYELISTDSIIT